LCAKKAQRHKADIYFPGFEAAAPYTRALANRGVPFRIFARFGSPDKLGTALLRIREGEKNDERR
jgi:hypothetical protein